MATARDVALEDDFDGASQWGGSEKPSSPAPPAFTQPGVIEEEDDW